MKVQHKNLANLFAAPLLFLFCLLMVLPLSAKENRIQEELRDPSPTLNPLRKALGDRAYDKAMKSGEYYYVSNKKCRLCHREFFVGRMKDPHVYTYERLLATGYEKNSRCLGCHTTGYNVESGYTDFNTTPELVGVQCEGCHGPGSVHVKRQAKDQAFGIPGISIKRNQKAGEKKEVKGGFLAGTDHPRILKRMCLTCHTKRWGRSFARTVHGFQAAYESYKTPLPGDVIDE